MEIKLPVHWGWIWLLVAAWGGWFVFHLTRTYSATELFILLPIGAAIVSGLMFLWRKGALWLRLVLAAVAIGLWLAGGSRAIQARRTVSRFKHFPPDSIQQIAFFTANGSTANSARRPRFVIEDRETIKKFVRTFGGVRPCWGDTTRWREAYILVLVETDGREIHLPVYCNSDARSPTASVVIQWKEPKGTVQSVQYHSPALYAEIKRASSR